MLTRLKLKRGEGQLTRERENPQSRRKAREPSPSPSISPSRVSAEASRMSEHEGEIPQDTDPREEERVFRKAFLDLTEMVRILYQERNEKLAGEGSKHPLEGEGSSGGKKDDDHSKKGHGGNGDPPPPSSPPSSSSSSSSSVHKHRSSGKSPFLKLDVKFELPMFNGEVNAEKLDNWIRQLEVYLRIQNMHDDATKIQLASLRMDGAALVWWEAKTKEEIKKFGKVTLTWTDFLLAIKKQFYPLAHMQKAIMNWQNFRQLKGQSVQDYTQEFRRRALLLGVDLQTQETLLKYIGGLHSYLRHTILMFNPTSLDEVCVQATHLEARGKTHLKRVETSPPRGKTKRKPPREREKRMHLSNRRVRK